MDTVQPTAFRLSLQVLGACMKDARDVHLRRYLRFRGTGEGECIALEMLGVPETSRFRSRTGLAVTSDLSVAVALALQADDEHGPKGVFVQQNALMPHVVARHEPDKWLALRPGDGIKAEDIASRRAVYVDFDPVRPRDVSSTKAERRLAFERAESFLDTLVDVLGDDRALGLGSSGNGIQIHVALAELPNDEETEAAVKRLLAASALICDDAAVKVDQSVSDARRICPAFGTAKRKGSDHQGEGIPVEMARPHRLTAFVCHEDVRRLSMDELLAACAALEARVPEEKRAQAVVAVRSGAVAPPSAQAPRKKTSWELAKDADVESVSEWLGLGSGAAMVCPECGSVQGYGRVPGANVTKCHHDRCASKGVPGRAGTRTAIDLVMAAKSVEKHEAVNLLAARFSFPPLGDGKPAKETKAPPPPPPASTGAAWEDELLRDDRGRPKSATANVELVLRNDPAWVGLLGFNELRNAVVFLAKAPAAFLDRREGDEWQDDDDVAACNWFQRNWDMYPSEMRVRGVISLVAHRRAFHPIKEELSGFVWDGIPRVDAWLTNYLGAADDDYTRKVGRWWLISAVARVMKPGSKVDTMLILEGPQGIRKSSALRALAGDDYFLEDMRDIGGIESSKQLRGKWIVELSELDAMRRAEASTIKRFVSTQVDNYRPSYGRSSVDFPRQCVFAGSTNHDDYLQDETGGRRFWPVACGEVDLKGISRDRAQLWAEAVRLYEAGERWWPETDEEIALCGEQQEERQNEDPWTTVVALFVAARTSVTTTLVLNEALGVEVSRMNERDRRRVGAVLRRLGWVRRKEEAGSAGVPAGGTALLPRPPRSQRRVFVRGPQAAPAPEPRKGREEGPPALAAVLGPRLAKVAPLPVGVAGPGVCAAVLASATTPADLPEEPQLRVANYSDMLE